MRASGCILGLVLGGAVVYAALWWFFGRLPLALFEFGWPGWLLDITFYSLDWMTSFATGIGIGLLARRYSLWIGAAAACIGNLLFRALDRLIFSPGIWPPIEPMWLVHSLVTTSVSGGVLSFSGEYLRTWWTSARVSQLHSRFSGGAVAGVLVASVVYVAVAYLSTRLPEHVQFNLDPGLLEWTYILLKRFGDIAVGLSIGWYSKSDGVRVGAIAFGLGNLTFSVLDHILVTPYVSINPIGTLHGSAVAALFGAAYALAGEYARSSRSSNKCFERTRSEQRAAQA
jgi:hypothetical protein